MRICLILLASIFLSTTYLVDLFYIPKYWPQPLYNFNQNPLSPAKVNLGRTLFYDPILSGDGSISCASCHSPYTAFAHTDHDLSHGIDDKIGTRNAPALMNLAWQPLFMWDGAIHHLDVQALAPITHPAEMGSSIEAVVNRLAKNENYRQLFLQAYGDKTVTGERTLKAISQFMLTLISANSKYDRIKNKKDKFTAQEANGYRLFQLYCATCHIEPLFTNHQFANNGLSMDSILMDFGRLTITGQKQDSFLFKIPTLRNIEYTYPYMHDGRFKKLSQVLNHYTKEMKQTGTIANEFKNPFVLTSNEKVDLISFLLTLSDREFVFNPNHQFPKEQFD